MDLASLSKNYTYSNVNKTLNGARLQGFLMPEDNGTPVDALLCLDIDGIPKIIRLQVITCPFKSP